jgi:hypothetical protein
MKFNCKVILFLVFSFLFSNVFSLSVREVEQIEELVAKHKLTADMSSVQKYRAYTVVAYELDLFGHHKKSLSYYKLALDNIPKDVDPLEVYANYLGVLYKVNPKDAESFYDSKFTLALKTSKSKLKPIVLRLWNKVFKNTQDARLPLYSQFFKDRDLKKLIGEKSYEAAFLKLSPVGLENSNINKKLEYDILSKLKGKRAGFFCQSNLKKYPNSSSVTMEICRFLEKGKLKYGTLKKLEARSAKELPHLQYLFGALFDLEKEK